MSFSDLPLISELLKEYSCKYKESRQSCKCGELLEKAKKKPLLIDKRLQNWEQWMSKRKKMHNKFEERLKRTPAELIMNSAEEQRRVNEKKIAIEYSKIPQSDTYRGSPGFWKMPNELYRQCESDPQYFAVKTKEDKCEISVIEHVGVPKQILAEKDVLPRKRNMCEVFEKSKYFQHRLVQLENEISLVDPYTPKVDELCVIGTSQNKPEINQIQNRNILGSDGEEQHLASDKSSDSSSILNLFVNGTKLSPNIETMGIKKTYVIFEYDVLHKNIATEYLILKNKGTVAIRYHWKEWENQKLFQKIVPDKSNKTYFYFNKNYNLILPGENITLPIWFKMGVPGTYLENWELCTKPNVLPENSKIIITMQANVFVGNVKQRSEAIKSRIENQMRGRIIKEVISTALLNVDYSEPKPIIYTYNVQQIFEAVNSVFDPMHQKSKYQYNREVVAQLQKFYKSVRSQNDPLLWNYRIDELRLLTKEKERKLEQKRRLRNRIEMAKRNTLKDKNNDARDAKISSMPIFNLTSELERILGQLEEGREAISKDVSEKYMNVYLILCTYFNKICEDLDELQVAFGVSMKMKYPKVVINPHEHDIPLRLQTTRFCAGFEHPPLIIKFGSFKDKPPPECFKDIPDDDIETKWKMYYNISDNTQEPLTKGKNKGKAENEDKNKNEKKSKVEEKNQKKKNNQSDSEEEEVEFDPFAITYIPSNMEDSEIIDPEGDEEIPKPLSSQISGALLDQFKFNMYVIIYTYLDKAISCIVALLETEPKYNQTPLNVIKEVEDVKYTKRLIDLKQVFAAERVSNIKQRLVLNKLRSMSKKDWRLEELRKHMRRQSSHSSSLWSILQPYKSNTKIPNWKPISYPEDHCDLITVQEKTTKVDKFSQTINVDNLEEKGSEDVLLLQTDIINSNSDVGLDPNWQQFKDVATQLQYENEQEEDDLIAYVEKVISKTSIQELFTSKIDKQCQKTEDEYVSDEEYFYAYDYESVNSEGEV